MIAASGLRTHILVVTIFLTSYFAKCHNFDPEGRVKEAKDLYAEYDFIIIGAGSAGAVIANRLTEVEEWTVLLLEAGGDETIISDVPGLAKSLQLTDLDWQYSTEPQPGACLGLTDQRCLWPRGKVLGGSSVLNYMVYVRGNRRDYDSWAAAGNDGWSYADVLPYFIKSEDNRNPYLANSPYHGTGGYMTIQESAYRTPLATAFVAAGMEMGYKNIDCNGEFQTGFMIPQATVRRGARCSTAKAFLRPVRKRTNLHISMRSHATKILIDSEQRAYGVQFQRKKKVYEIYARKEVILSAGSINSPQLLMISGVGPRDHLQEMNIQVEADLAVGYNLQDHVCSRAMVYLINETVSLVETRFLNLKSALKYYTKQDGPWASLSGAEGVGFLNTKYANPYDDWPDVQLQFIAGSIVVDGGTKLKEMDGIPDELWEQYYEELEWQDSWMPQTIVLRPRSRGMVRLQSDNPYDKPLIYANYFQDPHDIKVMVEGIKIGLALSQTEAFQRFDSTFYDRPFPGCEHLPLWTDPYWECFARQYATTVYHPVGTCKMGNSSDPSAVVDPRLRVYKIKNLRVADASIMPTIPSGNVNAAAIMIGEKASDLIKEDWLFTQENNYL